MSKATSSLYIVRVLPIMRGFRDAEATYFSSKPFTPGSIVSVPFRNKEKNAVVLSSTDVAEERSEIKNADFGLRKIKKQNERFIFHPLLLEAVHDLSLHYAAVPGEVLSAIVPVSVLEGVDAKSDIPPHRQKSSVPQRLKKRAFVQGSSDAQLLAIQKEIKKSLKRNTSVLILAPTVDDATRLSNTLNTLFPGKIVEVTSRLTRKNQKEVWCEVAEQEAAIVTVVTAGFLSVPLQNVGLCILYKSNSTLYQGQRKPYLDARVALEIISEKYHAPLLSVDIFIPIRETKEGVYPALNSLPLTAEVQIIDMTKTAKNTEQRLKNDFVLLSEELLGTTKNFLQSGKNVFWFVSRRGLYPATVCRDCGAEHVCLRCGSSLVLHETKKAPKKKNHELVGNENRFFLCHRCGEREDTLVRCRNCESWRLMPLGVGVDRVYERACELGFEPLILSQDHTPTKKSVKETLLLYHNQTCKTGRLLIGTDLAVPLLESSVSFSAIVSLDSRLALPSYTAEESALKTLLSIASLSREFFMIQTRRREHRIFKHAAGEDLEVFRKEEVGLRKLFLYPPFGTLIEISHTAKKQQVEERMNAIAADLLELIDIQIEKVIRFPLRGTKKKGLYKGSVVVKLADSLENRGGIRGYLMRLSADNQIKVDPENLW